jgi:hypothetical protein
MGKNEIKDEVPHGDQRTGVGQDAATILVERDIANAGIEEAIIAQWGAHV